MAAMIIISAYIKKPDNQAQFQLITLNIQNAVVKNWQRRRSIIKNLKHYKKKTKKWYILKFC